MAQGQAKKLETASSLAHRGQATTGDDSKRNTMKTGSNQTRRASVNKETKSDSGGNQLDISSSDSESSDWHGLRMLAEVSSKVISSLRTR